MNENLLYYGDNLDVLRGHMKDETVDLVYLDPPFNSNATYNVLFAEQDGTRAAAQIRAFEDTWGWDQGSARQFEESVEAGGQVSRVLQAFWTILGPSNMMAYLAMMAPRLVEMRRVMKPTASIYLHCDPTAGHYLKLLMDAVLGQEHFRNEIVWRRTGAHGKARRYGPIHDTVLFYAKSGSYTWNYPTRPYMRGHVQEHFRLGTDCVWRTKYYGNVLTGSGTRNGESGKAWRGFDPTAKGRHWAIPGKLLEEVGGDFSALSQHEKLDRLCELGYIKITEGQAWPMYERAITPGDGTFVPDIWAYQPYTEGTVFATEQGVDAHVRWMNPRDAERLGYPTQKPEALLERIIRASSNEGDVVLDPFCGCGTAVAVAQRLKRRWIGIDITHLAITLIRHRLQSAYGEQVVGEYRVIGEPVSVPDAQALAASDPYQFQWWALGLVGARPVDQKKGADKGIDGRLYFHDEAGGETKQVIISVKAAHAHRSPVHELRGVVEREKAQIGVLITMQEPTRPMKEEAASAGFYSSPGWHTKHPRLQLLTVGEMLEGAAIDYPSKHGNVTFKRAPRTVREQGEALKLPIDGEE